MRRIGDGTHGAVNETPTKQHQGGRIEVKTRPSYAEKLKDPRWQKKRLQILERDGWACQICDDTGSMLVVHHCDYQRDKDPWDYPDELLITLCEHCHAGELDRSEIEQSLIHHLRRLFLSNELFILNHAFEQIPSTCDHIERWVIAEVVRYALTNPEAFEELRKADWGAHYRGH